jgi:hypothetical protein
VGVTAKVEKAIQLDAVKKAERGVQTIGLGGQVDTQRVVLKLEILPSDKPKKKKRKKKNKAPEVKADGSIPEAVEEESYYEYYEEEVDEEDFNNPATNQSIYHVAAKSPPTGPMVLSTGGIPIIVNNSSGRV